MMKLERVDSDWYRVVDDTGAIIGYAIRLATSKWGAYGPDGETRLTSKYAQFDKPKDVLSFIKERAEQEPQD